MSLCTSYSNNMECALTLTNDFNIKLSILSLLFVFAVGLFIYSRYLHKEKEEDTSSMTMYYAFKFIPPVYILFSPLFLLLLRHNITLEIFLVIFAAIMGLGLTIFILITLSIIPKGMFTLIGSKEEDLWRTNQKHNKTNKKYG